MLAYLARVHEAHGQVVDVVRVEQRNVVPSILASGVLAYESQVTLVSELLARVSSVDVKEGQEVKRGQVLIRLDAEAARSEITQLQAALQQAQLGVRRNRVLRDVASQKLLRYQRLWTERLVEANRYEEAVAQAHAAEIDLKNSDQAAIHAAAALAQSRQRLSKTEIRAPMDGRVIQVFIKEGETAVPSAMSIAGGSLLTIADIRSTFAEVNIDETDIGRVRVGQVASIVPAAFPSVTLSGRVEHIPVSPRGSVSQSQQARTYAVKIRLLKVDPRLFFPGMSVRAELLPGDQEHELPSLPVQAVQYDETKNPGDRGSASVFVLEKGRVFRRPVEVGAGNDAYVQIRAGIGSGALVVSGPAPVFRVLRDGMQVRQRAGMPSAGDGPPPGG